MTSSSDSGWYSSERDSTRPSALQKGERIFHFLQPVNRARGARDLLFTTVLCETGIQFCPAGGGVPLPSSATM
ncbi:hypothetical protein EK904_002524 [Melospiza melodia maxima]|nr:hypothetical protein EK904_002524 [Melospiza melodia maxima]